MSVLVSSLCYGRENLINVRNEGISVSTWHTLNLLIGNIMEV